MSTARALAPLLMLAVSGLAVGGLAAGGVAGSLPPRPSGAVAQLPDAVRGETYEARLQLPFGGRCASDGYWRISGAGAPQGITADLSGLHGLFRQVGEYQFVIEAVNNCASIEIPVHLTVRARPLLVVSKEAIQLEVVAGSGPLTRHVLVSSNWAELPFLVTSAGSDPWLSVTGASMTPAADSALSAMPIDIVIRPQELQPGVYRAKLVISAWTAANAPTVDVTLVVKAVSP